MSSHAEMGPEFALHLDLGIKIIDPTAVGGPLQKPGRSLVSATVVQALRNSVEIEYVTEQGQLWGPPMTQ